MASNYFSIVLPTYNRAAYLPVAIQSVLDQTFVDFELIIVDDGSTDTTAEVVSKFADPRIKYFKKENEERSIARNFGIGHATGRYINFLDADDYFYSHHLKTAYTHLKTLNEPETLHLGYELIRKKAIVGRYNNFTVDINRNLAFLNTLSCNAMFIRSDVARQFNFIADSRAVVSEDWYVWLRLAARFKIHYVNEITSAIHDHDHRSLSNTNPLKFENSINVILHHLDTDSRVIQYYGSDYRHFKSENLSLVALYYSDRGIRNKALSYLLESFKEYPQIIARRRFWAIIRNLITKR